MLQAFLFLASFCASSVHPVHNPAESPTTPILSTAHSSPRPGYPPPFSPQPAQNETTLSLFHFSEPPTATAIDLSLFMVLKSTRKPMCKAFLIRHPSSSQSPSPSFVHSSHTRLTLIHPEWIPCESCAQTESISAPLTTQEPLGFPESVLFTSSARSKCRTVIDFPMFYTFTKCLHYGYFC